MPTGKRIQVVHIAQHLEIGGLESLIVELCRSLDSKTFRTDVLCLNGYDELYRAELESCGIGVHLVAKKHARDYLFLLRAAGLLRKLQADIIHIHSGCFLYGALIGRLSAARRIFYTAHGMPINQGLQNRIEEMLASAMTDQIIAVSDEIALDLRYRNRLDSAKLKVIINGIDTDRYSPMHDEQLRTAGRMNHGLPADRLIIGSAGRLEKIKNHSMLLKACSLLVHAGYDDIHLALAGSGSQESNLRHEASELGISEHVSFLGMQYCLEKLYPLFDLFALPSLTEGTSLALLEAQSSGLPAVATNVGGNSNIVRHGINGLLCPSCDHTAMSACLKQLVSDKSMRQAMGNEARSRMLRQFSRDRMVAAYQKLYQTGFERHTSDGIEYNASPTV